VTARHEVKSWTSKRRRVLLDERAVGYARLLADVKRAKPRDSCNRVQTPVLTPAAKHADLQVLGALPGPLRTMSQCLDGPARPGRDARTPSRRQANSRLFCVDDQFLPFDDDPLLSLILSKAFLLANDTAITDKTITSQIKRR
jgi:hypothetical protein